MMEYLVVVDVGTTAVKAAAVGTDLSLLGVAHADLPTVRDGVRVEQDPEDWWTGAVEAVRSLPDLGSASGLALTGQMQDLILVEDGRSLGAAILYSDHRATVEHENLTERIGHDRWFELTANVQDPANLAAKFLWLREHEPQRLAAVEHLLFGAHSYLALRACGVAVCDPTTASTTGLYAPATGDWAREILDVIDLDLAAMPRLQSPLQPCGHLDAAAAAELGLTAGIPVVHSAGDAGTTTVGAGVADDGGRYAYLGTSGWLAATTADTVTPREQLFTLEHPLPGHRIQIGPMLSVGACIDWVRDELLHLDGHAHVEELVRGTERPSDVLFLPYLAGERSPMRDPYARGVLIGLSLQTGPAQVAAAVMEGVALSLRTIETLMTPEPVGADPSLVVAGGGSQSAVWCQILADVFGRAVRRLDSIENVGVLGTARLSWAALGHEEVAARGAGEAVGVEPDGALIEAYTQRRELQARAYQDLLPVVHGLTGAPMGAAGS